MKNGKLKRIKKIWIFIYNITDIFNYFVVVSNTNEIKIDFVLMPFGYFLTTVLYTV
jgi:hypothetical protein